MSLAAHGATTFRPPVYALQPACFALTCGAGTLGGAIDFTKPRARDGTPNELLLQAGSHAQWQGSLTWGTTAGDFDGLVSAETRHSDG